MEIQSALQVVQPAEVPPSPESELIQKVCTARKLRLMLLGWEVTFPAIANTPVAVVVDGTLLCRVASIAYDPDLGYLVVEVS
ncbi:MAG TPA: hypothetical protein VGN17_26160 [Bryobacteraceae bacterium]|jgi:hypothetical protein